MGIKPKEVLFYVVCFFLLLMQLNLKCSCILYIVLSQSLSESINTTSDEEQADAQGEQLVRIF